MTYSAPQLLRSGKVAVLYGGLSAERDVSLKSGEAVYSALVERGIDAELVDTATPGWMQDLADNFAAAFIALHGPGGEDGTVQGALELAGVPYTGSGVMASSLAMDKLRTKWLWMGAGLPTPEFVLLDENTDFESLLDQWGSAVVKPANEGSSVGMALVKEADDFRVAFEESKEYQGVALAERCITGEEYTVAILGGRALPPIRLETDNQFYDYEAKYLSDETRYFCPCGLDAEQERELKALALRAFETVGCRGWGRVDVMADERGFYLLEVNTVPGMTDHSLVPMAAKAEGLSFADLVCAIMEESFHA